MSVPSPEEVVSSKALPKEADVVIVGGGIVGVTSALFLTEAGLKVVLCEKGQIAGEQSSRNWGWVRTMGRDAAEIPLAMRAVELWKKLSETKGMETGYRQSGILHVIDGLDDERESEATLASARAAGLPLEPLTSRQSDARLGPGARGGFASLWSPLDGYAEPSLAAPMIARYALSLGACLLTRTAVTGFETRNGVVCGVHTERGEIACGRLLLAGGIWTARMLRSQGLDLPLLKVIATAARVEGVAGVPDFPVGGPHFAFRKRMDGGYTLARRHGSRAPLTPASFRHALRFLPSYLKNRKEINLSLGRDFFAEASLARSLREDPARALSEHRALDPPADATQIAKAQRSAAASFPAFASARVTHRWAGVIDATPDAIPVIGPIEPVGGLFVACGFTGHGFGLGPGAARLVCDLLMGGEPCADPGVFSARRFFG